MTTSELLTALARECPNGVSFDPMAVRLWRQKVPVKDWQIEDLKTAMFQIGSGLWFSREMIADDESRWAFAGQSAEWLSEYGVFSVERLFQDYSGVFHHIATPEDCAAFLRHLGFTVAVWGKGGSFCSQPPPYLEDSLKAISETILVLLEEADGTLPFHEVEQAMPHLTAEALDSIRTRFLPKVHEAEVGGVSCWRSSESIPLPEDFSERLTTAVDTLLILDKKPSVSNLEFALDLFYRIHFREEYALKENDVFMSVCAKHYQGGNEVFLKEKKNRLRVNEMPMTGKRVRSQNTRFSNLDVPIGAELAFTKDSQITCTVLDDSNQVEYHRKAWSISALANHLSGGSAENGFRHFSYEGETLWERRSRLERAGQEDEFPAVVMSSPAEVQEAESGVIVLEGRVLSPTTWRGFRKDGTDPRVEDWVRRINNGETIEEIALEWGYAVPTVKGMISNFNLYFKVRELNGITPQGDMNV